MTAEELRDRDVKIRFLIANGQPVILFQGGPYDGKLYEGDPLPVDHWAAWDRTEPAMGGAMEKVYIDWYRMRLTDGGPRLVFDRTDDQGYEAT